MTKTPLRTIRHTIRHSLALAAVGFTLLACEEYQLVSTPVIPTVECEAEALPQCAEGQSVAKTDDGYQCVACSEGTVLPERAAFCIGERRVETGLECVGKTIFRGGELVCDRCPAPVLATDAGPDARDDGSTAGSSTDALCVECPMNNNQGAACPATPPAVGTPCSPLLQQCWYCAGGTTTTNASRYLCSNVDGRWTRAGQPSNLSCFEG